MSVMVVGAACHGVVLLHLRLLLPSGLVWK